MKRIIYIVSAVLLTYSALVSCERVDRPMEQGDGRPILFTAATEWPEITKTTLYGRDDIMENGFRVWGNWHKDPEGPASYTYDTEVFGEEGSLVSRQEGGDSMLPEKTAMWHRGYYCFAAVFPADISGSQSSSFSKLNLNDGNALEYVNVLAIDFGTVGYNLSDSQDDLMYAFGVEDNSMYQASEVTLDFRHAFVTLDIQLTHHRAKVLNVSLHGIHSTVYGEMKFRQDSNGVKEDDSFTDNMIELLTSAKVSSEEDPYYSADYSDGQGFDYTDDTITIVDDLLVFPETLSENTTLTIKLELEYEGQTKIFSAQIAEGEWAPGSTNVYKIEVDTSKFETTE